MKLTADNLIGTWIVAGSEIDALDAGAEIYQFDSSGKFTMILNHPSSRPQKFRYSYRLTDDGFIYGEEGNLRISVTAWIEEGFLIFRPSHGMETWSVRQTEESSSS